MAARLPVPVFLAVLVGAAFVRIAHLGDAPMDFHPARQYHSALIARALYAPHAPDFTDVQRETAAHMGARHELEPRLLEHVAAWLYRIAGQELLWMPRLISVLAWLAGALSLAKLAGRWFDAPAILVCLTIYAFLPFAVIASRSFQPDPLMVVLTIAAIERVVAWIHAPTARVTVTALTTAAAAIFVKPMALLLIAMVYLTIAVMRNGAIQKKAIGVFIALALISAPAAIYYSITMSVGQELSARFLPQLFGSATFWNGWGVMFERAVSSWLWLSIALLGFAIRAREARPIISALWTGYVVLGVAFPYHIHTHDYYSLPAVPIMALTAGYALQVVAERLPAAARPKMQWVAAAVLATVSLSAALALQAPVRTEGLAKVRRYEELGRQLPENTKVVTLDGAYGLPLAFHSRLRVVPWPLGIDFNARRLAGLSIPGFAGIVSGIGPADVFVVSEPADLQNHPELSARLSGAPVLSSALDQPDSEVTVYDLRYGPRFVINPARANFVFVPATGLKTPTQRLRVQSVGFDSTPWTLKVPAGAPIKLTPMSGLGAGEIIVEVLTPVDLPSNSLTIELHSPGVAPIAIPVNWSNLAAGSSRPPIGHLENPAEAIREWPATFSGWALDDVGVKRVVLIGIGASGVNRELAVANTFNVRPDLAQIYGHLPGAGRGAWIQSLDAANMQEVTSVRVEAEDMEGHRTTLGERAVVRIR